MTAMIRGFDEPLRDMIRTIGPDTIFVQSAGVTSFERRGDPRPAENARISPSPMPGQSSRPATRFSLVGLFSWALAARRHSSASLSRPEDASARRLWHDRELRRRHPHSHGGWRFNGTKRSTARTSLCFGNAPYQLLFGTAGIDPMGKSIRVVGTLRGRGRIRQASLGRRLQLGQDDFVVIPLHGLSAHLRVERGRVARNATFLPIQIALVPRDGVSQQAAIADVERAMRIRHGLRLDQPNDFDIVTQDAFLKLWDQISQGTFFALVVMSSIALMVGGIGVMAIMSIRSPSGRGRSARERPSVRGVRKSSSSS